MLEANCTCIGNHNMNAKLSAIAAQAADKLRALVSESESEILSAWDDVAAEAQASETKPRLRLSYSITVCLDEDRIDHKLSFGVRRVLEASAPIPDPDQTTLPLEPEEMPPSAAVDSKLKAMVNGPIKTALKRRERK